MKLATLSVAIGLSVAATGAVQSQPYPNKPVRLVVPYPAAGGYDVIARIMAAFRTAGPYALKGSGDKNVSYAQMMAATDLAGHSLRARRCNRAGRCWSARPRRAGRDRYSDAA